MIKDWLKNQLTPEKRTSEVYVGFVEVLQKLVDEYVEPTLERILQRRSLFTMTPLDLEIKMAELGRFFRIMTRSQASKPIILQQRLDEIHYKGTYHPIQSTIRRELNNLPATWAPLYAPKDQVNYPYGSYFADESTLEVDTHTYGDFFLTSRGKIKIPLNVLYVNYSGQDQGELVRKLTEEFNDVIVPLIPLHIVFDGFMFYLEFSVTARECVLTMSGADVTTRIDDAFKARAEHMADFQINNVFPGQNLPQQVRSLAPELHRFDQMPVDAWALDLVQAPAILPLSDAPDDRYRASANNKIEIDTLGLFGVQVAFVGSEMQMYQFPAGATVYELPLSWEDVKRVEKITYRFF